MTTQEGIPGRTVYIVSDGTGITAEALARSVLSQFNMSFSRIHIPFVDTIDKVRQAKDLPGGAVLKGQGGPLIAGPAAADVHLPLGQGQVRAHGGVVIRQGDQGHIHGIAEALIRGESQHLL